MDAPSSINIPDEYMCPITHEIMLEPMKLEPCSHIFDKFAIETWSAKSSSCPLCRKNIDKITPDKELEKKICAISNLIKENKCEDTPPLQQLNALSPPLKISTPLDNENTEVPAPIKKQTNFSEKAVKTLDSDGALISTYVLDDSKSNRYHALRCAGNRYFFGVNTKIDRIKAFYYYTKSAEGCDAVALRMLGKYYLLGDKLHPGLTIDYQLAEKYLWMASEMGDQESIDLHIFVRGIFVKFGLEQHFGSKTLS